jgi:hypothetical protein
MFITGGVVPRLVRCLLALTLTLLPHDISAQHAPRRPPPLTPAGVVRWRADLRYLAAEMPKRHRNLFHTLTREEFNRAVRRLDARIPALRRHEIILELARLAARVGDGHTNVAPARDSAIGFHALPVRLYLFADGLHIRAADSAHAGLVGARVVRLGRATAEEAVAAVRPLRRWPRRGIRRRRSGRMRWRCGSIPRCREQQKSCGHSGQGRSDSGPISTSDASRVSCPSISALLKRPP